MRDIEDQILLYSRKQNIIYSVLLNLLLVMLIGASFITFYGHSTGNFVISIDPDAAPRGIEMADHISFDSTHTRTFVNSTISRMDTSYESLALDEILNSEGEFKNANQQYTAYSFYIRNSGTETITIDYYMHITQMNFLSDNHIRVLIIEDDAHHRAYQKVIQTSDEDENLNEQTMPLWSSFKSATLIFSDSIIQLKPGDIKSFRIVIWIEEDKSQNEDNIQSGGASFVLMFSVREDQNTSQVQIIPIKNKDEKLWLGLSIVCVVHFNITYEQDVD
jgi:hypothetical protein